MAGLSIPLGAMKGYVFSSLNRQWAGLGLKVPLSSVLDQYNTHPGQDAPLVAQAKSLSVPLSGQADD